MFLTKSHYLHFYYALCVLWIPSVCTVSLNGDDFLDFLQEFGSEVGFNGAQEIYYRQSFNSDAVDGQSYILEISGSLQAKFSGPIAAAKTIKDAVERNENQFTSQNHAHQCCYERGERNDKFRSKVLMNDTCIRVSSGVSSSAIYPSQAVEDAMIENYKDYPSLKWQYFASEAGHLTLFPSAYLSGSCGEYDPRFRPFYVESASPMPKDVVLVIDKSGSMSGTRIEVAKRAALTVVDTLNPKDRIAVVVFSTGSSILDIGSSVQSQKCLALATPLIKHTLINQIKGITASGSTNYNDALETSFQIFLDAEKSYNDSTREKVLMFLTDGRQTHPGDPTETINIWNRKLANRVVVFTYAFGTSFDPDDLKKLEDMANQIKTDPQNGEIKRGRFVQIKDLYSLRSEMGSYYDFFSGSFSNNEPVFSVPYIDAFGLGMVTTVCVRVYSQNTTFAGAACVDITLSDLFSDIVYFKPGQLSYSFIIDGNGRTLMHPNLPQPSQVKDDPIFLHISNLERSQSAEDVISDMMNGIPGSKILTTKKSFSRGEVLHEGTDYVSYENANYFWQPVENTNFSVAIVVDEGDSSPVIGNVPVNPNSFHYHRIYDLYHSDSSLTACKHFSRYAIKDFSSVTLTPKAFKKPFAYLDNTETMEDIRDYEQFLKGHTNDNTWFEPTVIDSVSLTYKLEEKWKANLEAGEKVVWRYIGTEDGVMRLYPAAELPKNYDHTRRPWYIRSIANRGLYTLSAPYQDFFGAGILTTISKTILEESSPSYPKPYVAVVSTDLRVPYLMESLKNYSTICQNSIYSCFIIDNSGFIVVHESFLIKDAKIEDVENIHIIHKEPGLAKSLLSKGYMIKESCLDFQYLSEQFSYRINNLPPNGIDEMTSNVYQYKIVQVPQSNVFVVIKLRANNEMTSCCSSYGDSPDTITCENISCDCLCKKEIASFDYCESIFHLSSDAPPTCSPRTPALMISEMRNEAPFAQNLDVCFDGKCESRNSKSECNLRAGCSWCDDVCGTVYSCGITPCEGNNCQNEIKHEDGDGPPVIAIVLPLIIVFIVTIIFGTAMYRKRKAAKSRSSRRSASQMSAHFSNREPTTISTPASQANFGPSMFENNPSYINQGFQHIYTGVNHYGQAPTAPGINDLNMNPPTYQESVQQHRIYR